MIRAVPVISQEGTIREWVGVHHDITERRQANLNASFLASISEELLRSAGFDGPIQMLCGKLAEHLALSRCVFATVDELANKMEVIHDFHREGEQSIRGGYRIPDFVTREFRDSALAKEMMVVCDTAADPRVDALKHAEYGIGAFITIPLIRNQQLCYLFSILHSRPHDWREDEIELMQEVSNRLWTRLERSRAEDALARAMAESEQQRRLYHTVLSNTPDFIYVFDLNHRFAYINDALLNVYGMTWEEAQGKDWIGLGYEQWHADMHDREIDQVIATKAPIRGEIPFVGTTGRRIYDYIFVPVFAKNGEVEAVAGTTRDITDRKQAEAAQAAERKVFERVATGANLQEILDTLLLETEAQSEDGMRCSILLLDSSGRHLRFGAAPSLPDLYSQAIDNLPIGPHVGSCGTAAFDRQPVFVTDISTDPNWVGYKDLAATHGLAACCSVPVISLEGKLLGTAAMYYRQPRTPGEGDRQLIERAARLAAIIIERKQAEASLAEHTAELVRADRRKDEFLAMLAHELRNPLAPMQNATEILQSPMATPAQRDQAQDTIARQIHNMRHMIDDLLDVSRITQGKITLRQDPVELQSILTAAIRVARQACAANGQTLTVSLPPDSIFVHADSTRLEQVFGNLLGNACKYSGTGSHIILAVQGEGGNEVVIRISDDGIGIEPELLPRIFEIFVQSSRTSDRSHGGLGIGLTIVNQLVGMHGGTIEAHSAGLGHGTEFIVRLPTIAPPPVSHAEKMAPASPPPSRRILIVDDNKDAAQSMAMLQNLHGHDTRTACSGPEALVIAREFLPQVVILDIGLPGMDGFEVARRIRAMPSLRDSFLVALSGYSTDEDRKQSSAAGFNEHLAKPADLKVLGEWLRTRPQMD